MEKFLIHSIVTLLVFTNVGTGFSQKIITLGQPAKIDIREAGEKSIRITLHPVSYPKDFPPSPNLTDKDYPPPAISCRTLSDSVHRKVGDLYVTLSPEPLTISITNTRDQLVQALVFQEDGTLLFQVGDQPLLGMGEGGPLPAPGDDWHHQPVEFDRRGRIQGMQPRWQSGMYGSRNPVPLLIGTGGWALFINAPWGQFDLSKKNQGVFMPALPISPDSMVQNKENQQLNLGKGIPPMDQLIPGLFDIFIFDTSDPALFMKNLSEITGPAVMPPKWALGYMQSHRTLESDSQMVGIVNTFREKKIPVDAVIYLGTGFTPRGWNTAQPSFDFNPDIFSRPPVEVIEDLHDRHVKVILHMVPWDRDRLKTLHGTIPPEENEVVDESHIMSYWKEHLGLVAAGVDGWWPDEGDWFNLFERMKRHQMYYEGSLFSQPGIRPWSLHRNGYIGVAKWGGWVWSGDTHSSWKSLEAQVAVGINHSLSLSPFWGSDIGGFFPTHELTGELYARWFQFGAFTPSFRAHGRTWWTRLPWGWGLGEMGPRESDTPPEERALNNPDIEPIVKKYGELRYQLLPYTYTLAWEAHTTGMPLMRAMWLHYQDDADARGLGSQYLWGRDLLIAPVFTEGAVSREVYLPSGGWYDWWTNKKEAGGRTVSREVDLSILPIYVRAGAIIPVDPIRQYTSEVVEEAMTIRIYRGQNGSFTMYEDDGISLNYLKGEYILTQFAWDDDHQQLIIQPVEGIPKPTRFKITMLPDSIDKLVNYTGKYLEVTF